MSEKETPTPREELTAAKRMNEESTAAKSTTPSRQEEPTTVKTTPPPPKPAEESTAVKRALLFMYWVAALLGSDYVFTLSSGPNYFTRIDTGGAFDMRDSEPTKAANTQFSNAWTVWAAGQFVGSVLSRALSGALGWRPALFLYVVLMLAGNLMYVLADPSVAGSIRLAIAGKFVDGLGCGATALGIGYIPTVSARPKVASWRMSTFRLFVSVGMVVGTGATIGLGHARFSAGGVQYNPGNSPAAVQALASLVTLPCVWALVVEPAGARTKRSLNPFAGWRETGVWSRQTCTWLVFVFCYGLATSAANYFGPVFLAEQRWHQPKISLWLFLFQVAGLGADWSRRSCWSGRPLSTTTASPPDRRPWQWALASCSSASRGRR